MNTLSKSIALTFASVAAVLAQEPSSQVPLKATPSPEPPPPKAPTLEPTLLPAATPTPNPREIINSLSEESIRLALNAISKEFLDSSAITEAELQRATLEGLLSRLNPGLQLLPTRSIPKSEPFPFLAEILDASIGYIRPGKLDPAALSQLDTALASFRVKNIHSIILDLRLLSEASDIETVADFARRFVGQGKILFTIQKPTAKQERIFMANQDAIASANLVVLIAPSTIGVAEALAGALHDSASAILIGSTTAGHPAEFSDIKLPGGKILRIASAQIILPKSGKIFPNGITPDIPTPNDPNSLPSIFKKSSETGVSQFVFDTDRPRINEAALVEMRNPEISDPPLQTPQETPKKDITLQRAVDILTAIKFYHPATPPSR